MLLTTRFIYASQLSSAAWTSVWRYMVLHPQGKTLPLITCAQGWNEQVFSGDCLHINHRVWGNKKMGEIYAHLEGIIGRWRGWDWASRVTNSKRGNRRSEYDLRFNCILSSLRSNNFLAYILQSWVQSNELPLDTVTGVCPLSVVWGPQVFVLGPQVFVYCVIWVGWGTNPIHIRLCGWIEFSTCFV